MSRVSVDAEDLGWLLDNIDGLPAGTHRSRVLARLRRELDEQAPSFDELGTVLEARFPGQDADDLWGACTFNEPGPLAGGPQGVSHLGLLQQGVLDGDEWVWTVCVRGTWWLARGSCCYHGWDCQSSLSWTGA